MDITPAIVQNILLALSVTQTDGGLESKSSDPSSLGITNLELSHSYSWLSPIPQTWRIDGGDPASFRFFAIPDFARNKPPLQISVVVPLDQMTVHPSLAQSLQLSKVFGSARRDVRTLPLAKYLVLALSSWSLEYPGFADAYLSMPYGSQIVVETLDQDVRQARIHLSPTYDLEQQWLSAPTFEGQTGLDLSSLVSLVDWTELELDRQLHDSIAVVRIPSRTGPHRLMVLKTLTEQVQHMYHELRMLLSMGAHPAIIPQPEYVVVKRCRFGAKVGVCGFLLDYHPAPAGTLQSVLGSGQPIPLGQKLHWLRQLTRALLHIRDHGPGFYSDLKPSNVLLTRRTGSGAADGLTAPLLIDFEQRGSWYAWSPPEVQSVEFLDMLATRASSPRVRRKYGEVLCRCLPGWSTRHGERPLTEAPQGYSVGWTALDGAGRRRAQMFGLGKLMWCVFEEEPSCNTFVSIETLAEGVDQERRFPEFDKTPTEFRVLIRRCTVGAPEWNDEGFPVQRRGDKLVLWESGARRSSGAETDPVQVQSVARDWWRKRVRDARDYVEGCQYDKVVPVGGSVQEAVVDIKADAAVPTLEEVIEMLTSFSASVST